MINLHQQTALDDIIIFGVCGLFAWSLVATEFAWFKLTMAVLCTVVVIIRARQFYAWSSEKLRDEKGLPRTGRHD